MEKHKITLTVFVLVSSAFVHETEPLVREVDCVPSGFPVNFTLYTTEKEQYIAYYDSLHFMKVASSRLNSSEWEYKTLDSKIGWDSHNYLSLAVDSLGYIHLVGNMHSSPLIYYRSTKPNTIHSLVRIDSMTGKEEDITTYPGFITNAAGELVFHYRYGRSGDGYEINNVLDTETRQWDRLLDVPLLDGEGLMNAYATGPRIGPDGYYHMIWVWRDTWDCSTNHTLSYARSKNLIDWEAINGEKTNLPITIGNRALYVDTTGPGGGLLNIGIEIGFDGQHDPLILYHKYDTNGNTQLYISRYDSGQWNVAVLTDWDYRWDFEGMGSIVRRLELDAPEYNASINKLVVGYHHMKYGNGQILLDPSNLNPTGKRAYERKYPKMFDSLESADTLMQVNKVFSEGKTQAEKQYLLRWETRPPNRDGKPVDTSLPPSILKLIEY